MIDENNRAVCRRCNVSVRDCEPFGPSEFLHPSDNDCPNAKKIPLPDEEVVPYVRKRVRRAKNRGARLARKMRR